VVTTSAEIARTRATQIEIQIELTSQHDTESKMETWTSRRAESAVSLLPRPRLDRRQAPLEECRRESRRLTPRQTPAWRATVWNLASEGRP
jgi:hypothetical protein